MPIKSMEEKFMHGLKDLYDAEHQFLEAQREMAKQARSSALKTLIRDHIAQTEKQIVNLEEVFGLLEETPKRVKCKGAAGLVAEGKQGLEETNGYPAIRDTMIAEAAEKVEHYEIVSYKSLIDEAEQLGHAVVIPLLKKNLAQEEAAVEKIEQNAPKLLEDALKPRR